MPLPNKHKPYAHKASDSSPEKCALSVSVKCCSFFLSQIVDLFVAFVWLAWPIRKRIMVL